MKSDVEAKLGKTFAEFKAISYITQVVAGTNYIIKAQCDGEVAHIKIHKPLPHRNAPPELMAAVSGMTADSAITYFE